MRAPVIQLKRYTAIGSGVYPKLRSWSPNRGLMLIPL